MKWVKIVSRILISAFFALSAISKMMGVEAFEIYLYRSSFLSYDAATIAGRFIIASELLIAICLLIKLKFRIVWGITFLFLLIFSIFLAFQMLLGADENCFCLGELMEMSPAESLIKNALLLLLLMLVKNSSNFRFRNENWAFAGTVILSLLVPVILSPPDVFVQGSFDEARHDQEALMQAIDSGDIPPYFTEGKNLIAFYSLSCKYCRMASTRIGTSVREAGIDNSLVHIVFWGDSTLAFKPFFEETFSPEFEYAYLSTEPYLAITKGRMPLILLIEDGKVIHQMNYRNLDEGKIEEFFLIDDF